LTINWTLKRSRANDKQKPQKKKNIKKENGSNKKEEQEKKKSFESIEATRR